MCVRVCIYINQGQLLVILCDLAIFSLKFIGPNFRISLHYESRVTI